MNKINIADNLQKMFYDYKHSKFLECNSNLALENSKKFNYSQDINKNNQIMPCFVYVTSQLENMYKEYWLHSGTLLGKSEHQVE